MENKVINLIPNSHEIVTFLHCGKCVEELSNEQIVASPKMYAHYDIGYTPIGLQIWCVRHNCNIIHIDFEGQIHPANTKVSKK